MSPSLLVSVVTRERWPRLPVSIRVLWMVRKSNPLQRNIPSNVQQMTTGTSVGEAQARELKKRQNQA